FTDIPGAQKSVTVPATRIEASLGQGVWFDGSAVEGLARVAEHDLYLRPDLTTFARVPWVDRPSARMICDLAFPDGRPFLADPRQTLKRVLAETGELGFTYRAACELEFSIFSGSGLPLAPIDSGGYFEETTAQAEELCRVACRALVVLGVDVEMSHHEVAPGQHEIDLAVMDALALADAIVALKTSLRTYGRRRGLLVSFMPKPIEGASGSGLHIQQELLARGNADAFFATDDPYQLSENARRFIAGQLAHARGLCAVIAPLVNSYKRLMGGAEAPGHVSWARTNRGSYIRVPNAAPGGKMRIELRAPDPSCNPYLALAAMLAVGMDGIRNGLALPEPVEELGRPAARGPVDQDAAELLPRTLDEALEGLEWDPVVRDALGQEIYERFLAAKEQEWEAHSAHVSLWELRTYLERA
ncbi:MAG TPA: glutamine synthetase family protein, partial [Verrucomicrobiae bacterium]|nr:glutamine synthetase family protein [Verrucomicrobiae bacterium]